MKSLIFIPFLVCSLLYLGCNQPDKEANAFVLKGKISGQDTGMIVLGIHSDSAIIFDTALLNNGEFVFKGNINEPYEVELDAGNDSNRTSFYIDPTEMNILLTKNNFDHYRLIGSRTDEESKKIDSLCADTRRIMQSLREATWKNSELLNNLKNEKEKKGLIELNDSLDFKFNQVQKEEYKIWLEFIKNHPKSYISPLYLNMLRQREFLSLDSAKDIFNSFDNKVKVGLYGRQLSSEIRIQENTQIGAYAPDFKAVDINGRELSLSQFRGKKIVLLEFWASWCRPCRSGFPYLSSLYDKYNPQGFEIIAIANLDINQESWKSAIAKEGIGRWYHLATIFQKEKPLNSDILQNYPLGPIPMSFLIDKSGCIVGSYTGHTEDNEKKLEGKIVELMK